MFFFLLPEWILWQRRWEHECLHSSSDRLTKSTFLSCPICWAITDHMASAFLSCPVQWTFTNWRIWLHKVWIFLFLIDPFLRNTRLQMDQIPWHRQTTSWPREMTHLQPRNWYLNCTGVVSGQKSPPDSCLGWLLENQNIIYRASSVQIQLHHLDNTNLAS